MMIKNDTAIRNCLHVVFDPYRDGGTGYTHDQQSAWLADRKSAIRKLIADHIASSEECSIYRDDYEIVEDDLGKAAAPRIIVLCRFDGVKKWGKKDANENLTAAWKAMQPLVEQIEEMSAYIYATGTPGEDACTRAADLVQV